LSVYRAAHDADAVALFGTETGAIHRAHAGLGDGLIHDLERLGFTGLVLDGHGMSTAVVTGHGSVGGLERAGAEALDGDGGAVIIASEVKHDHVGALLVELGSGGRLRLDALV